jgi:hypothetical protein
VQIQRIPREKRNVDITFYRFVSCFFDRNGGEVNAPHLVSLCRKKQRVLSGSASDVEDGSDAFTGLL